MSQQISAETVQKNAALCYSVMAKIEVSFIITLKANQCDIQYIMLTYSMVILNILALLALPVFFIIKRHRRSAYTQYKKECLVVINGLMSYINS